MFKFFGLNTRESDTFGARSIEAYETQCGLCYSKHSHALLYMLHGTHTFYQL